MASSAIYPLSLHDALPILVVSAILFVPSLGLLGAALSALFVSFVMLIAHLLAVKTLLRS